jgi:hypothetical protein
VLPAIESQMFTEAGVDVETFRGFLRANQLALIVSRNVTQRDRADRQQPFNLVVPGGTSSIAKSGTVYDVAFLQVFQADALRGYGDPSQPSPGRRLLARAMHEAGVSQAPDGPDGAVRLGLDGSMAALVPARRALSWQLTDENGDAVVRERNWLSFQPGEIRVCSACHGINELSQTGAPEPTNPPQALHDLLVAWKEGGGNPSPSPTPMPTATPAPTPVADTDACGGITIDKPKLRVRPATGIVTVSGKTVIPKPWSRLAPARNGVRLVVDGAIDVLVPGGSGWTVNAAGTRWLFRDPAGHNGGVRSFDIVDRSRFIDGKLVFALRIEGASTVPTLGAHDLSIGFGTAAECASAHFDDPLGVSPRCTTVGASMVCR